MTNKKLKQALSLNKVKGAKVLAKELILSEHKAEWSADKQAEYNELFPVYRDMTDEEKAEYDLQFTEENPKPISYDEDGSEVEFEYPEVVIEYITYEEVIETVTPEEGEPYEVTKTIEARTPSNYLTYSEWINETVVVSEAVEAVIELDEEGFETITTPYQPEVTELVRPYTALEVTDAMIEAKFLLCGYDYKAKREAEYPSIETYIDGIVKGDEEQVQSYIAACLAIKEKYPKPNEG